ncbi:Anaphase-promoting complex subunit 1 [Senna tora]|uniref:Anaphase-promoting complex subunit 1 n=1 Tax=Senna tora TaxID=362788 RepID=A0A834SNL9_9FABA|nr:Anaphase-promoting complex subunit 1 [Senna tora]
MESIEVISAEAVAVWYGSIDLGEAEIAGMLQLISGLTSKEISLFISTL